MYTWDELEHAIRHGRAWDSDAARDVRDDALGHAWARYALNRSLPSVQKEASRCVLAGRHGRSIIGAGMSDPHSRHHWELVRAEREGLDRLHSRFPGVLRDVIARDLVATIKKRVGPRLAHLLEHIYADPERGFKPACEDLGMDYHATRYAIRKLTASLSDRNSRS